MWEYRALVDKVIDGDTLDVEIDLGFMIHALATLRLAGLNAPEHGTPDGDAATAYVTAWVAEHEDASVWFTITTEKDRHNKDRREKYGRYLATVTAADGACLNADLLATGHAKPWDGHGPRPV